ncbi:MAG: PAS domain S-box protein [Chloroflexales bacterium]|nr:PAS domain S-box protein [Chloroflexales bacterium]
MADQQQTIRSASSNTEAHIRDMFSDSIIENVNVWLNVHDNDLNIIYWNKVAEEISGYSRAEVLGHTKIWEWLYPDEKHRKHSMCEAYNTVTDSNPIAYSESNILCRDGQIKTILWNSRRLEDEQGEIYGAITFGYDITDRKQAEEALKKAHDELSVLYDVASVASESIDLNTILKSSLDRVLPTMKSRKGAIHLWEPRTETLYLAAHKGLSRAAVTQLDFISLDGGLISQVFEQSKPTIVSDMGKLLKIRNAPANVLHTYLGVPMRAKGKTLGVISVFGKAGHLFSSDETTLLTSIAHQIGVTVENARLFQEAGQLAVIEERRRLARDLHDSVTQSLFSLTLFAEAGQRLLRSGDLENAEKHLTWLNEIAQKALKEMRLLVYELRPLVLETGGLVAAIQQRLNAVERRAGIKAHLIASQSVELPLRLEEALYGIIQEALNNALKHASAAFVTVQLEMTGDRIEIKVIDDGIGFDSEIANQKGGMGLVNMRERAEQIGGQLRIVSSPEKGVEITITIDNIT